MKRFDIRALLLGLISTSATPALAQNLITNPTFDTDYSGWPAGDAKWVADDCCGNPASGSVTLQQHQSLVSNCINVTGGSSYDLTFWSKFAPVNVSFPSPNGFASVAWLTACGGDPIGPPNTYPTIYPGDAAAWHQLGATFVAPASAHGVSIDIGGQNCGLSCGGTTWFDNVAFGPAGTVPVELQSFEID